jgi:ABC-type Na+ efflux pump permease subunit
MNIAPPGADRATWRPPFAFERATDLTAAEADLFRQRIDAILVVARGSDGALDVTYRTAGPVDGVRSQLAGFTALSVGIIDWTRSLPPGSDLGAFKTPAFRAESISAPVENGQVVDAVEAASRSFLGTVFIILMFITILIYGMWVATGVATEKSSRVMELMISAASPRQMLAGKVVGIGAAGLTQYVAIALPALILIALQDRIARAALGPDWAAGSEFVGLTPALLGGYGVFFLLGFALFALIYAAMGSFVSRPDDLQTLSLPLSLVAMVGYLTAILAIGGGGGTWVALASFVPPFSPFVMLARIMVSAVEPWEVMISIVLLVVAIAFVAVVATRMYAAGVLLYGQRPGLRAFVAAARRA